MYVMPPMPEGWEPPPMPVTCQCGSKGDEIDGHLGYCHDCDEEVCVTCGSYDDDIDGRVFYCAGCTLDP